MSTGLIHPLEEAPSTHSRVNPLLKSVSQVVLADWMCQGSEGWLELYYGQG